MIRHPITIEHLARALNDNIAGMQLVEAWSQKKDTVDLSFEDADGNGHNVHISTEPDVGTVLLSNHFKRARKNTIDVFPELLGKTCAAVVKPEGDRIITFIFDDIRMHVLLFSGGSGNVFVERDGTITNALHDKKEHVDQSFTIEPHPISLGKHYKQLDGTDDDILDRSEKHRHLLRPPAQ